MSGGPSTGAEVDGHENRLPTPLGHLPTKTARLCHAWLRSNKGVSKKRVESFPGELSDKGPSLLFSLGKVRCCPCPPRCSPASISWKWNLVEDGFWHLPQSGWRVPTWSAQAQYSALTLHFRGNHLQDEKGLPCGASPGKVHESPGWVSIDPFPDENGCPWTRLLTSCSLCHRWQRCLSLTWSVFPHLWATSPWKPHISVMPGHGVTREWVKNESSWSWGDVRQGALTPLLPGEGVTLPPRHLPALVPWKRNLVEDGFWHLPQSSLHVPTSSAWAQDSALTLRFRGNHLQGKKGPPCGTSPGKVPRVPQDEWASTPPLTKTAVPWLVYSLCILWAVCGGGAWRPWEPSCYTSGPPHHENCTSLSCLVVE